MAFPRGCNEMVSKPLPNGVVCEWKGITCDSEGNVEIIQLVKAGLEGTLDSSLGQLTTLLELDLSSNAFTGSIPSELVALPKIKVIDLRLNKLSGSIPFPVSNSLEALHLGHNALTGRPLTTSFSSAGFQSLTILDLKYNQLEGTLPSSFTDLSSIETLDLSNNRFRGKYDLDFLAVVFFVLGKRAH